MTKGSLRKLFRFFPRLATNYFILSGGEFFAKILAAVAFAYMARVLGPQSYGYLEFTLALVLIGTLFVDFGLSSIGAREIAKDPASTNRLFVHISAFRFFLATGIFILFALVARWIDQPQPVRNLIFLYGLSMLALPLLIQWVFQGQDRMQYVALASVIRWSVFTAGILVFVRRAADLWVIPIIELGALLCTVGVLTGLYLRRSGIPTFNLDRRFGLDIFRRALPVGASELVWAVKVYFATITLGLAISGPEVGWFTSAHRIVISLHAFVWLYFYNLLPSIARSSQQPEAALKNLMAISIKITAWAAIFIGVFGVAFSKAIIHLFYGDQYHQAISVFSTLIWLIPLALLSGNYRYTLIGYDRQQLEFLSALAGAVINIGLSLILIPRMGTIGAAWAIVISEVIILWMAVLFVKWKIARLTILPHLWRPLIAGASASGILLILGQNNLWMAGTLAALVYFLIFILFNPGLINKLRSLAFQNQAAGS